MAQEWTVTKAFLSTVSKEDKTPQVVQTQGGPMHKFIVQVEDQPVDGWLQILKKQGNEVNVGDKLYGDIVTNQWNKPQFNKAQRPDGQYTASAPKTAQTGSTQATGGVTLATLNDKLDQVIAMLSNQNNIADAFADQDEDQQFDPGINLNDLDI